MSKLKKSNCRVCDILRNERRLKKMSLREVSENLNIDIAIISKLERGERAINKALILAFANLYQMNSNALLAQFYADKLKYEIADDNIILDAIKLAEEDVLYRVKKRTSNTKQFLKLKSFFDIDQRVKRAWVFGSVARGDDKPDSDIDIMIEFKGRKKYSMFDLIDIAHGIEKFMHRKVDLVEKGTLHEFAQQDAEKDLILIYG
ncbi:MAG: nucleotidyltransferase domain-containing protein [Chitinophagaceae bacterium]